jgi:hypothetical protein
MTISSALRFTSSTAISPCGLGGPQLVGEQVDDWLGGEGHLLREQLGAISRLAASTMIFICRTLRDRHCCMSGDRSAARSVQDETLPSPPPGCSSVRSSG